MITTSEIGISRDTYKSARVQTTIFLVLSGTLAIAYWIMDAVRYISGAADIYDLGSTSQSLYLISHGHWLAFNTVLGMPTILDVDAYILYLLAWPFRYLGGVYFLFALQSIAILTFGIAMFQLVRQFFKNAVVPGIFGLICMISLPIAGADWYDFHVDFIVLLGLSLTLIGNMQRKTWLMYLGAVLALLSKNEAAIPLLFWAAAEMVYQSTTRKHWIAIFGMSLFVFGMDEVLIPYLFGASSDSHMNLYAAYGNSVPKAMVYLLLHPWIVLQTLVHHWRYLVVLVGPFAFLPLFGGLRIVSYIVLVVLNEMSSFTNMTDITYQYAVIIAFFLGLSCQGYFQRADKHRWLTTILVSLSAGITIVVSGLMMSVLISHSLPSEVSRNKQSIVEAVKEIPDASVWAVQQVGAPLFGHQVYLENDYEGFSKLWYYRSKFNPHSPVVLIATTKTSDPLTNEVFWKGVSHGYQILKRSSDAIALIGHEPFTVVATPSVLSKKLSDHYKEPFPLYQSALLMNYTNAVVDLSHESLRTMAAGPVTNGYPVYAPAGTYHFTFYFVPEKSSSALVGRILVYTGSRKSAIKMMDIFGNEAEATVTYKTTKDTVLYAELYASGPQPMNYRGFVVQRQR